MPTIVDEHAVSCQGVQIHHFMPERSQVLHESLLNLKVEGSEGKMASIGKTGSVEVALHGRGNIHGSGSNNGISFCIQAGTTEHVDNYFNYLWVHRTPLPMGLHCQNPLVIGERSFPKGHGPLPQLQSPVCCLMTYFTLQEPPTQCFHEGREANANVVAFFSRLVTHDLRLET